MQLMGGLYSDRIDVLVTHTLFFLHKVHGVDETKALLLR